jgi:ribosomal protein S18 acetylase RimI-like enzyme
MYKLRIMLIKDYNEIMGLWKNTEGVGISDNDDSKKSIGKFLEKNPNTCFVAEYDKKIIGTIMGGSDGRRGHIYHLMVKPEHRKNGIGKKLLEKTEKALKKDGIRKTFLVTFKKNRIGNKFWRNNEYGLRKDLNYLDKILSV